MTKKIKFRAMGRVQFTVFKNSCEIILGHDGSMASLRLSQPDHTKRALHASVTELLVKLYNKTIFASDAGNKISISVAQGCAWVALMKERVADAKTVVIIDDLIAQIDEQTV